jgi:hypothetical protein
MNIQVGDLVRINLEWDPETLLPLSSPAPMKVGIVTKLHETFACAWVMVGTGHVRYNKRSLEVINESTFISQ